MPAHACPAAGGPLSQFKDAVAAAAALGVGASLLARAEQRIAQRNQQASAVLQASVDAAPFDALAYNSSLQQAQEWGLHADVARAQRELQLRRHRLAARLRELATHGGAGEVEAACADGEQLGLGSEAEAAHARLEQRQATALEELRQAAHHGSLKQYTAAVAAAERLNVSTAMRQACKEQLRQRQQEADQRLHEAACRGNLAAVRRRCEGALMLGLRAAVGAAEEQVQRRRQEALEQLAASTRCVCEYAILHDSPCARPAGLGSHQLESWVSTTQHLAAAISELGTEAALLQPPAACAAWPPELRGWLEDASWAAELELAAPVAQAVAALKGHLEALEAATQVVITPLQQACSAGEVGGQDGTAHASTAAESISKLEPGGQAGDSAQGNWGACPEPVGRLLACFREWQAMQHDRLPLVEGAAQRMAVGLCVEGAQQQHESCCMLDLSMQGLSVMELPAGNSPVVSLNLSRNAITR